MTKLLKTIFILVVLIGAQTLSFASEYVEDEGGIPTYFIYNYQKISLGVISPSVSKRTDNFFEEIYTKIEEDSNLKKIIAWNLRGKNLSNNDFTKEEVIKAFKNFVIGKISFAKVGKNIDGPLVVFDSNTLVRDVMKSFEKNKNIEEGIEMHIEQKESWCNIL